MANQGVQAYMEQMQNDFWNPQFAEVENDDHQEVIQPPAGHNHPFRAMVHRSPMHVGVVPLGVPLILPYIQFRQPIPSCHSFQEKMIIELLNSNDPEDKKHLNSIVTYIARAHQRQALCASLLSNGYNLNVINEKNQTMLHIAFYNNSHSVVDMIVNSPSFINNSIDYTDSNGLKHLHIACIYGKAELVERYLKTGSEVNAVFQFDMAGESSKFTPLHFAVSRMQQHIVKLLLGYGADANLLNLKGQTPLHITCCCSQPYTNTEIMKELIAYRNVKINVRDNEGNTPLLCLFYDKYEDPFRHEFKIEDIEPRFDMLMKLGANVAISNKEGDTVLHLLIKNLVFGHNPFNFGGMSFKDTDFVRLIKKILDADNRIVNLKNKLDETPLQLAVSFMSLDIVQLLLDYNASLDNLKMDYFCYPNVIPIFEPVRNLVSIVDILSERGYTLSPEDNIHILTFLIHEACTCKCLTYDSDSSRMKFDQILNFGSPRHVMDTLRKCFENQHAAYYYHTFAHSLQYYADLVITGKEVKHFLENRVSLYYTEDQRYKESKHTELKQMVSTAIRNEVNLYDMMLKNPHDIIRLIKSIDFRPTFADNLSLFRDNVKGHITKALIRGYVETSTYEVLKHKLFFSLPDLCCAIIIRLLSNLDILNMYVAAHPPMISC